MSYLDNTTITVDAILTKKGREKFATGTFNITKFALSDDEIDYNLYNVAHPSGSDYYAVAIENLPILEAIPDETKAMRFKLITLPKGTAQIPLISAGVSSVTLYAAGVANAGQSIAITPSTVNGLNDTLGYTATLVENYYVQLFVKDPISRDSYPNKITTSGASTIAIGKSFVLNAKQLPPTVSAGTAPYTTSLIIYGNETGGSIVIPINITKYIPPVS